MRYALLTAFVLCLATSALADEAKWIFRKIAPTAVRVVVSDGNGSGTIIAVHGDAIDVLTCHHVIDGHKVVGIDFDDEGEKIVNTNGVVIADDPVHDLAVVRAPNPKHRSFVSVSDQEPELYDELYVVAAPLGVQRRAAIERLDTKDARAGWSMTGTFIPGMSGSGIVNDQSRLVCVLSAMSSMEDKRYTQLGYCVPLQYVKAILKGLPK